MKKVSAFATRRCAAGTRLAARRGGLRRPADGACLDVLGAVAEALGHGHLESPRAGGDDAAVQPVAPPGGQLDAQQAHRLTDLEQALERIACGRARIDPQGVLVGGMREAGLARQQACPRLAVARQRGHHHERQQGEELAVLPDQVVAQQARAGLRQAALDAHARLPRPLAVVEGAAGHDGWPPGGRGMGTKPGNDSTRPSHPRMAA